MHAPGVLPLNPEQIESVGRHRLHRTWSLIFDQFVGVTASKRTYESNLKTLGNPQTAEAVFCFLNNVVPPSEIPNHANYHFFVKGISPIWEDPQVGGAEWIVGRAT